jgi:hypothetical protein
MIQVRFSTFEFDADHDQWVERLVAELLAGSDEVTVSGPHVDWVDLDISILDPETGRQITRGEDPQRWARLLPLAYRSGDVSVAVAEVETATPVGAAFHIAAG